MAAFWQHRAESPFWWHLKREGGDHIEGGRNVPRLCPPLASFGIVAAVRVNRDRCSFWASADRDQAMDNDASAVDIQAVWPFCGWTAELVFRTVLPVAASFSSLSSPWLSLLYSSDAGSFPQSSQAKPARPNNPPRARLVGRQSGHGQGACFPMRPKQRSNSGREPERWRLR